MKIHCVDEIVAYMYVTKQLKTIFSGTVYLQQIALVCG